MLKPQGAQYTNFIGNDDLLASAFMASSLVFCLLKVYTLRKSVVAPPQTTMANYRKMQMG